MVRAVLASDLLDLLADKHARDVFIPECKTGPTHGARHQRIDAWAMRKSWTRPFTFGYEIKVSRGDWISDEKWRGYLPYCSHFAFVCPSGLIDLNEVPVEAGLLWASKNGKRLYTKKKTPEREVEIPDELFRYVLMNRVRVDREQYETAELRRESWARWVEKRVEERKFGHLFGTAIGQKRIQLEESNQRMRARLRSYRALRREIKALGIDLATDDNRPGEWGGAERWRRVADQRIDEYKNVVAPELIAQLRAAERSVRSARSLAESSGNRC